MIRGSEDWLVRAMMDWILTVKQGLALVTYRSFPARERVLRRLEAALEQKLLSTEILQCKQGMQFVASVAHGTSDVLFVLDPQRLLFGEENDQSPMWVNFHRETLVARPGVQIWWFPPQSAIHFATQLPDLNRFFLFREDLTDEDLTKVDEEPNSRESLPLENRQQSEGSLNLANLYLDRAVEAAKGTAERDRIWMELGVPALRQFLQAGQPVEISKGLDRLSLAIGDPVELLGHNKKKLDWDRVQALLVVGGAYLVGAGLKEAEKGRKTKECSRIVLDWFDSNDPVESQQIGKAKALHQLGMVAQEERDSVGAREWYLKSLAIEEKQVNLHGAAATYHQLGIVAEEERDFAGAREWYLKSLVISEKQGNVHAAASSCHQLGMVAEEERDFARAREWYLKSLAITEKQGDLHGAAISYHQLGMVAEEERDFAGAREWYLKSLAIIEKQGNIHGAAISYHQLGRLAEEERDFEGARGWYLKSLAIEEKQGNLHGAAFSYGQLGIVAGLEGQFVESGGWLIRSIVAFRKRNDEREAQRNVGNFGIFYQRAGTKDQRKLELMWREAELGEFPSVKTAG